MFFVMHYLYFFLKKQARTEGMKEIIALFACVINVLFTFHYHLKKKLRDFFFSFFHYTLSLSLKNLKVNRQLIDIFLLLLNSQWPNARKGVCDGMAKKASCKIDEVAYSDNNVFSIVHVCLFKFLLSCK